MTPTRFASTDELTDGRGTAPHAIRSYPRPERCWPSRSRASTRSASRRSATWSSTSRIRTATAATAQRRREPRVGEDATVAATVRSRRRQADAQPASEARRGAGLRSTPARWSPSGSTSPGSPASSPRERTCCCTGSSASATSSGSPSTSCSATGVLRCTRSGSCPSIPPRRASRPQRLRELRRTGCGRSCSPRPSRCPRGCASTRSCPSARPRSTRCTSPRPRTRSATRAAGSPSRSCSCSSWRWRGAGAPGARGGARGRSRRAGVIVDRWRWSLPFELTGDQVSAIAEIDADLARERPMQRLLMGEVGSGKTVCALAAMLRAVENGAPGRAHGAHRDARRAAPPHARLAARRHAAGRAAHRLDERRAAARAARPAGERAAAARGRHARADRGRGRVPRPRGGGGRRAASLRRPPARRARRQGARGARAARAPHDRHADPAHAVAHRLRRPRRDGAARAAARPPAGRDLRGRRRPRAGARVRAHPRGDRRRAAVLRRLPARRGVRGAPGQGRDRGVRAPAHHRVRATCAWS